MRRIDKAFQCFKGQYRSEIIDDYCPYEMDDSLDDFDINTYTFSDSSTGHGCRGITCEECWDKEI